MHVLNCGFSKFLIDLMWFWTLRFAQPCKRRERRADRGVADAFFWIGHYIALPFSANTMTLLQWDCEQVHHLETGTPGDASTCSC